MVTGLQYEYASRPLARNILRVPSRGRDRKPLQKIFATRHTVIVKQRLIFVSKDHELRLPELYCRIWVVVYTKANKLSWSRLVVPSYQTTGTVVHELQAQRAFNIWNLMTKHKIPRTPISNTGTGATSATKSTAPIDVHTVQHEWVDKKSIYIGGAFV